MNSDTEQSEFAEADTIPSIRVRKLQCLLVIAGVFCLSGLVFPEAELLALAGLFVTLFCLLRWVQLDAAQHDFDLPRWLSGLIILMAVIGLPLYFLRTRGLRGILNIAAAAVYLLGCASLWALALQLREWMSESPL